MVPQHPVSGFGVTRGKEVEGAVCIDEELLELFLLMITSKNNKVDILPGATLSFRDED